MTNKVYSRNNTVLNIGDEVVILEQYKSDSWTIDKGVKGTITELFDNAVARLDIGEKNQINMDMHDMKQTVIALKEGRTKGTKPREEVDAEIKRLNSEIKKMEGHFKRVNNEIKKLNSRKPKRKTKDPLAQKKQKLINQVNDLGDEAFTPEELTTLKTISKAKTDKDLKKFTPIIEDAQKRVEFGLVAEDKVQEGKQADLNNAMDALTAKDKEIENYDGDKRSKEFKQLRSEQIELEEALDLAMEENRGEALTDESLQNQAENIHDVLTSIGGSITYTREQLEQMNDAKLVEIADKEGIESSDRNTIIAQYLDNMGDPGIDELEQMNMGIPLRLPKILANKKERTQFFAELNEAWRQAKERHGLDDYAFDAWVDAIASRQPSNTRELFLEWAEHASPAQLNRAVDPLVDRVITGVLGRSDRFNPQEWDQIGEDIEDVSAQIKESAPKINDEDSDLSAESENIINTTAFSAFQTNLNSEVFEHLVDSINSGAFETFEDFLNEISDPMYELMHQNGQTPVVAANENIITRSELMQFYVSNLVRVHLGCCSVMMLERR